ncbi:MAG: sugar phosphate nucleotidyltransferase [Oligoflexia bacterium]|nr:sugar phosphate nucleotidyltransferase [Oligoflexia bacterium]
MSHPATNHPNKNVPIFILAGGLGTRISEETTLKPKPMIEIGDVPILVHIMRSYYAHGFNDFVICAGYRAWEIKNYFLSYEFRSNDLMIDHRESANQPPATFGKSLTQEKWRVRVIDTGADCMTGGRAARAFDLVASESFTQFGLTYGDGVCDVDLAKELEFHRSHGKIGTVLGVRPTARFGELDIVNGNEVAGFLEKPESKQGLINGGFFFFNRDFRKYLGPESECVLERSPLERLATDGQLRLYRHDGFWQPMDTLRDKNYLQGLWDSKKAPWAKR